MAYEFDFFQVGRKLKPGDVCCRRFTDSGGEKRVCTVDAGYEDDGKELAKHIKQHYGHGAKIYSTFLTHPDDDHMRGFGKLCEAFYVDYFIVALP